VPVAERVQNGARHAAGLRQAGRALHPVLPAGRGRALATTFWGRAWCDNLGAYAALANRLERGRRYLRHGLVIDLGIESGVVRALVSGSELYEIDVRIRPMPRPRWRAVVKTCAGKIDSLVELLAGRFDASLMAHVCRQDTGLFPSPAEIRYQCTCPDGQRGNWLCKHVAATLYGVGVRLDEDPEMLFRLRGVAHADLITRATARLAAGSPTASGGRRVIAADQVSAVFGVELDAAPATPRRRESRRARSR